MIHSIVIEQFGIRLRPVQLQDAPFIVMLRNMDHTKGKVGDSATDTATQEKWLEGYFARDGDYYFIIETSCGISLGTYGIYEVEGNQAESGRWIVHPEVPAAIPSIVLGFEVAFERLGLARLKARTVSTNHRVLSLNRRLGFQETKNKTESQMIAGKLAHLIEFSLDAQAWGKARAQIVPLARLAEVNIRNWEKSFLSKGTAA